MKNSVLATILLAVAVALGIGLGRWWPADSDKSDAPSAGERRVLYWRAPMDPNYRRDEPGKSPMGMDLVPVYADEMSEAEPGVVKIDSTVVSNLGVRTALAERGELSRQIETVGYIGYDENTFHQINTRVDGWIEKLFIKATGDPVTQGQVLFELYSPTLVNAQQEYLAVLNSSSAAMRKASHDRLVALGLTSSDIKRLDAERSVSQRVRIDAPSDGVVVHLGVREGSYITPGTEVMAIATLDRVWVLAEVFERQAAWVQVGQQAEIGLDYLPGKRWQGVVDYIYPELDQKTRTLKVRLLLDNEAQVLRPNMFARIAIAGEATPPVVHVPRGAVIRGGSVNRVVLDLGEGRFRSQAVEVGIETGNRVEMRSGIAAGDRIVTSGQFLIDSESNIDLALARMDDSRADAAPMRVTVPAVVKGLQAAERRVTLRHEAIAGWSWPAMTMGFDVSDGRLLDNVKEDQAVEVVIEKRADGRYIVTDIRPGEPANHQGDTEMPQ